MAILPLGLNIAERRCCMRRQPNGRQGTYAARDWPAGPARASVVNKKAQWLSSPEGVQRLLAHLQSAISEPILPKVGNTVRSYFKHLRRRKGETMTNFCARQREEYEYVSGPVPNGRKDNKTHTSSKRSPEQDAPAGRAWPNRAARPHGQWPNVTVRNIQHWELSAGS